MEDQETVQFELAALRAEVAELRDQRETRSTRRNMLRLAGAAAVGGVAAVLGSADDAAALGVTLGATNDAGAFTTSLTSSHGQVTLFVQSSTSPASAIDARSTGDGTGVYGTVLGPTANAFAVWGSLTGSTHGFGVVGSGGAAQLLLNDPMHAAKPSTGAHLAGEVDARAVSAMLSEAEDDPDDLEALDRIWAEEPVTFGPGDVGCPKASAMVEAMHQGARP